MSGKIPKTGIKRKNTASRSAWDENAKKCASVATDLEVLSLRKTKVLFEIDLKGARRCLELAQKARELHRNFTDWKYADPGLDVRLEAVKEMYELLREARAFGIDF